MLSGVRSGLQQLGRGRGYISEEIEGVQLALDEQPARLARPELLLQRGNEDAPGYDDGDDDAYDILVSSVTMPPPSDREGMPSAYTMYGRAGGYATPPLQFGFTATPGHPPPGQGVHAPDGCKQLPHPGVQAFAWRPGLARSRHSLRMCAAP